MIIERIGFTGTQHGMTQKQIDVVASLIAAFRPEEVHHGDCVGADERFHRMCVQACVPRIIIHPPDTSAKRAYCAAGLDITILAVKPYLERNHDIVDATQILIATPQTAKEQQRSGTWATIRRAFRRQRPVFIVQPDGAIQSRIFAQDMFMEELS